MPKQYSVDCTTSTHWRVREGNRRLSEALITNLRMTAVRKLNTSQALDNADSYSFYADY